MTLFDVKFCFRGEGLTAAASYPKEYFKAMIEADIKYINNIIEAEGFVSYERICSVLGIAPDPELIGQIRVYYRTYGKELYIMLQESPIDDLNVKYVAKIKECSNDVERNAL